MSVNATMPRQPHPEGPTRLTLSQLADAQWQLDQAHQQQDISRILKGVVTNMHCLAPSSQERQDLSRFLGHAHYLYACYLKSQINSSNPPHDCSLESVWSLQVDLDKDMPQACSLMLSPSMTHRSGWYCLPCHPSGQRSRTGGAYQLLWMRHTYSLNH